MLVVPPPLRFAVNVDPVRARRSAVAPPGDGNVVRSMNRYLSRVIAAPVLLVILVRRSRVPKVAFPPGVGSRASRQADVTDPLTEHPGSTLEVPTTGVGVGAGPLGKE